MARFTREFFDNDVPGNEVWQRITDYLRDGAKSVELLSRVVDRKKQWELRVWDSIRNGVAGSNAAGADEHTDY